MWKTAPRAVLTAAVVVSLMVGSAFTLTVTGAAAAQLGALLHLGDMPHTLWSGLRWPTLLLLGVVG